MENNNQNWFSELIFIIRNNDYTSVGKIERVKKLKTWATLVSVVPVMPIKHDWMSDTSER